MKSPRPLRLNGQTYESSCACGKVYVTCNDRDGQLFEVFIRMAKTGTCGAALADAIAVNTSKGLRSGVDPVDLAKGLIGIRCYRGTSCMDVIGKSIKEHAERPSISGDKERLALAAEIANGARSARVADDLNEYETPSRIAPVVLGGANYGSIRRPV